mgnify:CR=1 FL=1
MKGKILVAGVVGPTASGKTRLGVALAKRLGGEVISADSMQVYKGMTVGTAKPTKEEMEGVPHHLLDFLDPGEAFSVAAWCDLAREKVAEITGRGKLPILVGGTGLYVSSLLNHIQFAPLQSDPALREELQKRAEKEGGEGLLEELRRFDPSSAAALHPNNLGRIIRAIEVYRLTGVPMSRQQQEARAKPSPYYPAVVGLAFRDRAVLYERIDRRVDEMLENGLCEEAQGVYQNGGKTALQAYFEGECSLAQAVDKLKMETRRYAKRQMTWFKREQWVHWLYLDDERNFQAIADEAAKWVEMQGLLCYNKRQV